MFSLNGRSPVWRPQSTILNLINNSIKFTNIGEVKLKICKTQDHVKFIIHDTGKGMKRSELDKIFKRKYQTNLGKIAKGSGIGLSVVEDIIQEFKGEIQAESKINQGTSISLILPINLLKSHSNVKIHNFTNKKKSEILIIEDDIPQLSLYDFYSKKLNLNVHLCSNLIDAKKLCENNNYNIITSDLTVENSSPENTIEFLNSQLVRDSRIILLSAASIEVLKNMCKKLKNDSTYIQKPVDVSKFFESLMEKKSTAA